MLYRLFLLTLCSCSLVPKADNEMEALAESILKEKKDNQKGISIVVMPIPIPDTPKVAK